MENVIINVACNLIAALLITFLVWLRARFSLQLARRHPDLPSAMFLLTGVLWALVNIGAIAFVMKTDLSLQWAIIMLALTSLVVLGGAWRELNHFWRIGLRGADREISSGLDYRKALDLCHNYLSFLGTGASKLTGEYAFENTLLRCRPDVPVRFLLSSPDDANLRAAARRAGRDESEYRQLVLASLRKIAQIKQGRGVNIEVRFYKEAPEFRLMFIDRRICLVSYNIFGEGSGSQLPQLHVVKAPDNSREISSFYYPFEIYFENLWKNSEPWKVERFL